MRFPIRIQILLPTSLVMLVVVLGSFCVNTWLAQRSAKLRIQGRIDEVTKILERSIFPLTDGVLEQMAGLTGAQFVLINQAGDIVGRSSPGQFGDGLGLQAADVKAPTGLGALVSVDRKDYFHRVLPMNNSRQFTGLQLHAFFGADEYRRIWQQALLPSLVAASTALAAALATAYWIGSSVSRSTQAIVGQLRTVSEGDFTRFSLPRRNDELRDIATEINRMATMLERYEADVRDTERMKTMVAMGAGLAHQLRNAATGCRMALDIYGSETNAHQDEALRVARRQLALMENYLQRFLLLAKVEPNRSERVTSDLRDSVTQAVSLVDPSARHLNVAVETAIPARAVNVTGDPVAIEQAIVNLLLNAIEAAAAATAHSSNSLSPSTARVTIELSCAREDMIEVIVGDNGRGPQHGDDVFAPFVSDKKSGVGLGLAVVKEVAREHDGDAHWQRTEGWTEFVLTLPLTPELR